MSAAAGPVASDARGGARGGLAARLRRRLARAPGPWLKPVVFVALLVPFGRLVQALLAGGLGPDPIEALTHATGELALQCLLLSLALTPLRLWLKAAWPVRLRRMIGLFAFFYAALHVAIWVALDQELDLALMLADVVRRPYVLAGTVAFAILVPLAATSTRRIARRLGARWGALHRGVYLAAAAATVHWAWLAKGEILEPWAYVGALAALLAVRFAELASAGRPRGQPGRRSLTVSRSSLSSVSLARTFSAIASDISSPCTIS